MSIVGHQAGQLTLRQLFLELLADQRPLVGVFYLILRQVSHSFAGVAVNLLGRAEARGTANVEAVVKPRWGERRR